MTKTTKITIKITVTVKTKFNISSERQILDGYAQLQLQLKKHDRSAMMNININQDPWVMSFMSCIHTGDRRTNVLAKTCVNISSLKTYL